MENQFDLFCERIISEILTAKNKRREHQSRYFGPNQMPSDVPRKAPNISIKTPSQKSKLGYQQYVGTPLGSKGIRIRNRSEKHTNEIGIAKGLNNHLRVGGVNPKKPGADINSKQGDMEVKYTLGNGVAKVGATGKVDYSANGVQRNHLMQHRKKFR